MAAGAAGAVRDQVARAVETAGEETAEVVAV
jgi:hypothetical protein